MCRIDFCYMCSEPPQYTLWQMSFDWGINRPVQIPIRGMCHRLLHDASETVGIGHGPLEVRCAVMTIGIRFRLRLRWARNRMR